MAEAIQPVYHNFDLGFDTEDVKRVSIQQDSDKTHILVITIYTNDDQMNLDPEWEYHITMRKPDGKLVVDTENIEVNNNKLYVTCTAQMLSAPGTSVCQLVIYNNSQAVYTNKFYIYVDADLIDGTDIESADEFNSLVKILRAIQRYEQIARTSSTNASNSETAAETSATNAAEYERQIKAILDGLDDYDETITELLRLLENKSEEIENLKRQIQNSSDSVTNLLNDLQEMGLDKLQELLDNANDIYNDLVNLNSDCSSTAENISNLADSIQSTANTIEAKATEVGTKYNEFISQYNDFESKMNTISDFLDDMDEIKNQILADQEQVARSKTQALADASSIASAKTEIDEILADIRRQYEAGTFGFDPIIVSDDEPDPEKQAEDDMWLKPYE